MCLYIYIHNVLDTYYYFISRARQFCFPLWKTRNSGRPVKSDTTKKKSIETIAILDNTGGRVCGIILAEIYYDERAFTSFSVKHVRFEINRRLKRELILFRRFERVSIPLVDNVFRIDLQRYTRTLRDLRFS